MINKLSFFRLGKSLRLAFCTFCLLSLLGCDQSPSKSPNTTKQILYLLNTQGWTQKETLVTKYCVEKEIQRIGYTSKTYLIHSSNELLAVFACEKGYYDGVIIEGHGSALDIGVDAQDPKWKVKDGYMYTIDPSADITSAFLEKHGTIFQDFMNNHTSPDAALLLISCETGSITYSQDGKTYIAKQPIAKSLASHCNEHPVTAPIYYISLTGVISNNPNYPSYSTNFLRADENTIGFDIENFRVGMSQKGLCLYPMHKIGGKLSKSTLGTYTISKEFPLALDSLHSKVANTSCFRTFTQSNSWR